MLNDLTILAGGDSALVLQTVKRHSDLRKITEEILRVRSGKCPLPESRSKDRARQRDQADARSHLPWWRRLFTSHSF